MYLIQCRRNIGHVIGQWFTVWEGTDASGAGEYLRTLVTLERDRLARVRNGQEANPDSLSREFVIHYVAE